MKNTDTSDDNIEFNLDAPEYYINRELSLLQFQWRVLEEAQDKNNPLLERVKFLAIVASNMEEFFMVRVGGLHMQRDAGVIDVNADGLTPARQLAETRREAQKLMEASRIIFKNELLPELDAAGIHLLDYDDLTARQKITADNYFDQVIFPVLTPLAFDTGHPFPHISNLSLNLAVMIKDSSTETRFARIKVPPSLPAFVPLKRSSGSVRRDGTPPRAHYFVWISQLIAANIDKLFPGLKVIGAHAFHVTRNADMEIQELEAEDLLETVEESIRKRRFGDVVRLMVEKETPEFLRDILEENLNVDKRDVYPITRPMVLSNIMQIARLDRHDLKDRPFIAATPRPLRLTKDSENDAIFTAIRQGNILLHQPYDSFTPVIEFLKAAARDPNVLAIKQTLYRVGNNSPVVKALLQASREYGKQVAVLVELKARFDEESNIGWARLLEQEGVHVTYGLVGLKTHSKIALVVRREGEHIRRYVHLGTGNYNHVTANIYEDIGMFTCDDEIGADASDLFNYLTGYSLKQDYRKLLIAPINLRTQIESMIRNEIERQRSHGDGYMILKMNALVDKPIIHLLYEASQAGVKVELIVRGICCLRPGIKGLSENIRVTSIVGRFLEHSRIYYFHNGGDEKIYLGSADLMPRNLNQRVEVLFPVEEKRLINHIHHDILEYYLKDNLKARIMQPDGTYIRIHPEDGETGLSVQDWFIQRARRQADSSELYG